MKELFATSTTHPSERFEIRFCDNCGQKLWVEYVWSSYYSEYLAAVYLPDNSELTPLRKCPTCGEQFDF